jgi:hypothetical protein
VSEDPPAEHPAGARPVADAPVDALVARADELARRWAMSLISARALSEMASVPLDELARQAPELCAQLARALSSDGELAQLLEPAAASSRENSGRAGSSWAWLARASDAVSAVRDVESLRRVVWEAALRALRDPSAGQVADLSDRLAFVCASLLAAVLAHRESGLGQAAASSPAAPGRERILYSTPQSSSSGRRAVLIDERDEAVVGGTRGVAAPAAEPAMQRSLPGDGGERSAPGPPRAPAVQPKTARARPWDTPLTGRAEAQRSSSFDAAPPSVPEATDAVVQITRGPPSPVERRA